MKEIRKSNAGFLSCKRVLLEHYASMEQDYYAPREIAMWQRVDNTIVMCWIRTSVLLAETIREGRRHRHRIMKAIVETLETPYPPQRPI